MAKVEEQTVIQRIIKGLRLSPANDKIPNEVNEKIRVVFVANPPAQITIVRSTFQLGLFTALIFRTPADKDFFLSVVHLGFAQLIGAFGINTEARLTVVIDGVTHILLNAIQPAGSVSVQENHVIPFPIPIKVDRDTDINLQTVVGGINTFAKAVITGFTVEP